MGIEMGEKAGGGQMLEARRVVCHLVGVATDVRDLVAVAMVPLMEAGGPAQVGSRAVRCDSPLVVARDGRSVVGQGGDRSFSQVVGLTGDVAARQDGGLFQVAVGEVTSHVVD
jgi:hypothetical protein